MNRMKMPELISLKTLTMHTLNRRANYYEKRIIIGVFMVLLGTQFIYSQSYNTRQGYIVTNENDTVYGYFKDRSDLKLFVNFRRDDQVDFLLYTPGDISGFSFDNKSIYKSCDVPLDSLRSEKLFMQVLVRGYITLYYSGDAFFMAQKDMQKYILDKKENRFVKVEDPVSHDEKTVVIEDNRYKSIIRYLVSDCPDINKKLNNLTFTPMSISEVVSYYNNFKEPEAESLHREISFQNAFSFGLKLDYLINDMKNYDKNGTFYNDNFVQKQCLSGGLVINYNTNRKISLQAEALLTQRKSTLSHEFPGYEPEVANWNMLFLEMPITFYYTFPTGKVQPHIFAGGLVGFKIADNSDFQMTDTHALSKMDKDEFGTLIGSGLTIRLSGNSKLRIEYYYEMAYTKSYLHQLTLTNQILYTWKIRYSELSNNISVSILF